MSDRSQRQNPLGLITEMRQANSVYWYQQYGLTSKIIELFSRVTRPRVYVKDIGSRDWVIFGHISADDRYDDHLYLRTISTHFLAALKSKLIASRYLSEATSATQKVGGAPNVLELLDQTLLEVMEWVTGVIRPAVESYQNWSRMV